jgi:hypothetical protein
MKENLVLSIDEKEHRFKGIKIGIEAEKSLLNWDVIPSQTTKHETDHALATDPDNLIDVTVIPGHGYSGRTRMRSPDIVAAAAAHANGRSGTGYDMFIVHLSGDEGSAIGSARNRLSAKKKYRPAVESLIEQEKTVSGGKIKARMAQVDEELELGRKVNLEIKLRNGKTEQRTERAKDKVITIEVIEAEEGEEYFLPRAA